MKLKWFLLVWSWGLLPIILWGQEAATPLSIDDCIRIALQNNSQLKIAKNQLKIAEKDHDASYSNILPTIDVSASGSKFKQAPSSYAGGTFIGDAAIPSSEGENYNTQFSVNQNIYDGGFWWNNISRTRSEEQAQEFAYHSELQNTIVSVKESYYNLLRELKLLEVYNQAVERSEEQLERTETMYELGSVAKVDVFQARVNLGNDRINYLNQENTVKQAKLNLNTAMGRDPLKPLEIKTETQIPQDLQEVRTLIDHAVENNPFQKQQEQSYQSAKLQTKIAKSNYYPRLTAFFDYSRRVPEFDLIFKNLENEFTWFAGLSLRWNLFNGFADKINVEQAKIQEKIAREQMVDSRRNLISNVKSLYDNLQALREIIEINKTNLESAREEYRLAQERYNVGSGTALELRDAQVRLTNAEQILVATEYNAAITYARLQQAIGKLGSNYGGNESDMN